MTGSLTPENRFTSEEFRSVMGRFATGVTVVTVQGDEGPHGTTVNAFTALSLDPPLVLLCLDHGTRSARLLERSPCFGVNILGHEQLQLGRFFASEGRATGHAAFAGISHRTGVTGALLLDGSVGHLECHLVGTFKAGDHTIYVGEVVEVAAGTDTEALVFHRGRFLPVT
jgi:flavin reductase (DIM6/NTAB) family NADH-FMN oxidoreductase RutF